MLVGGVVIQDQVNVQRTWDFRFNLFQKSEPFLMPMPRRPLGQNLAVEIVQSSEERDRAMPIIVVRPRADSSLFERQARLRAFQSLTLALFITAQHDRSGRRIKIKANYIPKLCFELGIIGELK